ncbi:MAG: succinate dehydrogenase assembly factor 2 [Gammaproteobacteria bacterium]|nr:succinate dehydrogenase assembly factor 2 [Gammaproteobacteria bacterium]
MSEQSRLRWQCRRGMKELDVLLEGYLNNNFSPATPPEQQAFAGLLELPDPILMAYIVGRASPEKEEQRRVIDTLRRTSGD